MQLKKPNMMLGKFLGKDGKAKILNSFVVLMLIVSSIAGIFFATQASAAYEDFTLWTEIDNANNCIHVINATHVNFNVTRDDAVYLYKDYGTFTDFTYQLAFIYNGYNDATYSVGGILAVTNTTGDLASIKTYKAISVVAKGSNLQLQHYNSSSGTYDKAIHAIDTGKWYYLTITKSGNTCTVYCYNDSARTILYFTLSIYLYDPAPSYRYIETAVGTTVSGFQWANVTVAYLDTGTEGNSPPVISNPSPANGATGVSISTSQLSVYIADPDGDTFDWTIETKPNIGSSSGIGDTNGTKTCAISGLAYGTTYTWYVNVTDANGATSTATYTFTTEYDVSSIPSSGQPVTKSDFLQWNGVDITMKYDILNDAANMTVVTSVSDSFIGTGWHGVGAPSICKSPVNDTYYIIVRERHNDTVRGLYFALYRSTDLQNWQLVWRASRQDVVNPPATVYSIERSCLRYLNGTYYFYFTAAVGGTYNWKIYYVKAATPEQIDDVWLNGANWNQILTSYYRAKDPWVGFDGNKYFLFCGTSSTTSSNGIDIFIDDNPEFTSPTQVMKYTDNSHSNTGCIFFDNVSSNDFIAWTGNINDVTGTVYWYFFNSSDGTAWNLADTWDTGSDNVVGTGNRRYMDYYSVAYDKTIIVMEWDYDNDGNLETVLWDYSQPPVINISISPTSWAIPGNPQTGSAVNTSYNYFTITNTGNTNCMIKIAVNNSANWIYTDWATYSSGNYLDYFTANFSTDGTTWSNIAAKDANGDPQTVLVSSLAPGSSISFGIKVWIPKALSTTQTQQFTIYLKAYQA
jgi:hypothetical protein